MTSRNLHELGITSTRIDKDGNHVEPKSISSKPRTKLLLISVLVLCTSLFIGFLWYQNNYNTTTFQRTNPEVFLDLDEIITNLSNADGKPDYLKLKLVLMLDNARDLETVKAQAPLINDALNIFLRELRIADITGSGGALMIKAEMLKRINKVLYPIVVKDLLFKEFLIN